MARALLEAVAHQVCGRGPGRERRAVAPAATPTLSHLCTAQTREVMDAMTADAAAARLRLSAAPLRVDGGASSNGLLLQVRAERNVCFTVGVIDAFSLQVTADLLGRPVVRPADVESTARGAALAAGCALGLWSADEVLADAGGAPRRSGETAFVPDDDDALRRRRAAAWHSAVQRTLCWTDVPPGVPRWETRGVARRHALACLAAGAALGAAAAAAYHRYRRASA